MIILEPSSNHLWTQKGRPPTQKSASTTVFVAVEASMVASRPLIAPRASTIQDYSAIRWNRGCPASARNYPKEVQGAVNSSDVRRTEVWAQLFLCAEDCTRIRDFFISEFNIKSRYILPKIHLTVYHARRPMLGVVSVSEPTHVVLAATETRFMVMAPGGENPRPELVPGQRKVGIRVHKQSAALPLIFSFRDRLLQYETKRVLGNRMPSTHKSNAFGARHYQPHMGLLSAGSRVDRDLSQIGIRFRQILGNLTFDRFAIEVKARTIDTLTRQDLPQL